MKRRTLGALLGALLLWGGAATAAPPTPGHTLSLGLLPMFPSVEMQRRWGPVAQWLEASCQVGIRLVFSPAIPEFEQGFLKGRFDLAFLNPYHAVMASQAQAYAPLVRDGQSPLKGILVVKASSAARQLRDLDGARIAFPAPNALAGSLLMRALLEREHGLRFTPVFSQTHTNGYRQVLTGDVAAAGGVMATLRGEDRDVQEQLRVLYETPGVAPHPLVAHPRVPEAVRRCITATMTRPNHPAATTALLSEIQMPQPIAADYARDYRPLEKLGLDTYASQTRR